MNLVHEILSRLRERAAKQPWKCEAITPKQKCEDYLASKEEWDAYQLLVSDDDPNIDLDAYYDLEMNR